MTLVQLVGFFRKGGSFESFCDQNNLSAESEVIEIYGIEPLALSTELAFFPIEETGGKLQHTTNGNTCRCLFDFYRFLDAIEESNSPSNVSFSDRQIAEKLLHYAVHNC